MSVSLVILAAGQGTRMNSDLPKVLHRVAGSPLLHHAMQAGRALGPERVIVVTGHGSDAVTKAALAQDEDAICVQQEAQLGTAHAVAQAAPLLADAAGDVIVLYGDTPFIRPETLEAMQAARARHAVVPVMGGIETHRVLPLSLTFDHRAVTGSEAARFLKALLEDLARAG